MLKNVSVKPLLAASSCALGLSFQAMAADVAIVIHGGAGTILKKNMTPEREKAYV